MRTHAAAAEPATAVAPGTFTEPETPGQPGPAYGHTFGTMEDTEGN
jgi:hypothetical protein